MDLHQSRLTRRRALTSVAWSAPVIVVASAAPAYAGSGNPPAIVVSAVNGARRTVSGQTDLIDVTATFTNNGGAASALSAAFEWILVGMGAASNTLSNISSPWTAGSPSFGLGFQRTFTRVGGLGAGASDTLTFTFQSFGGRGTITVAPMTTPTGAHSGSAGTWGDSSTVDMDVTSISNPQNNGVIFVNLSNNGVAPALTQSVAVTISPLTGTFSMSGGGSATNNFAGSPTTVASTASPTTVTFTRNLPLEAGASIGFQFTIAENGNGNLSAVVTNPSSANNATAIGTYQ